VEQRACLGEHRRSIWLQPLEVPSEQHSGRVVDHPNDKLPNDLNTQGARTMSLRALALVREGPSGLAVQVRPSPARRVNPLLSGDRPGPFLPDSGVVLGRLSRNEKRVSGLGALEAQRRSVCVRFDDVRIVGKRRGPVS
jgi:hypothetical protein